MSVAADSPAAYPCASAPWRRGADLADHLFGRAIELLAALLLVAEIVILGSGVTSRYLFNAPLIWTDELGSMLFLWLSMLGAVIAFRRGEHMRMTGIVSRVGPRTRALLDAVALAAGLLFLLLVLGPALDYAQDELIVVR